MRNPNIANFDRFDKETLADELLRHFKKRAYQRQEKTKDLSQILQPLMRVTKEFQFAMPKSAYAKALKVKRPNKQVVIKNIGNLKLNHLQNSLNYVITNSKKSAQDEIDNSHLANALDYATSTAISVIDENGDIVDNSKSILDSWADDLKNQKANANLAWHLAFSIDEPVTDENLAILQKSVQETLDISLGGSYKYIIAIHAHQNKPHCHAIINKTHIYSKKKLHFDSRDEIKDFFFNMREHFKSALLGNSMGKLVYDNSYAFERDSYSKKLQELEQINLQDFSANKSFDFDSYMDKILLDLRKKESLLNHNKEVFKSQLVDLMEKRKEMLKNDEIISLIDNPKYNELCDIIIQKGKAYDLNIKTIKKITSDLESIKLFSQTIRNNLSSMSFLKQKETLIKSFKRSRNISKDAINKILLLEQEIKLLKKHQKENSISIISSFGSNIKKLNAKSNLFILVPMQENLVKYKNALKSFEISDDSKNKELDSNKQRIETLIQNRLDFLLQSLQSALEKQDEVDEKYLKRFAKNLDFMIKEIGYGVNFLSAQDESRFKNLCKIYRFNKNLANNLIKDNIVEPSAESIIDSTPKGKQIDKDLSQALQDSLQSTDNTLDSTHSKSASPKQTILESSKLRGDIEWHS